MLYIEAPSGTGYSYSLDGNLTTNDIEVSSTLKLRCFKHCHRKGGYSYQGLVKSFLGVLKNIK